MLWVKLAGWTVVAALSLVLLHPPAPPRAPAALALPAAAAVGALLFLVLERSLPPLSRALVVPRGVGVARAALLLVLAANEEAVWRRLVVGAGLAVSPGFALAVGSLGFALAHRTRRATHLLTGSAFGAVYLVTGALAAAVASHLVYNLLVAASFDAARGRASPVPP